MRHVSHGLSHGLRHLDIAGTWLRRNAAFVAVSLLVPLVALGALAVPPRLVQGVAAPLWRAIASPLADVSARHIPGLHGDPAATPSETAHLASARTDVAVANVTGGLLGRNRRADGHRPTSEGLESADEQRTKPPSGGAGATNDDAEPSEGVSGGNGDAGEDGGSAADDETGSGRGDRPGGGRGNRPGRGNGDRCSAKTPRTAAGRSREAGATAAETATAVAEATAATAASALTSATGAAVKTTTPIGEAALAGVAGTVGAAVSGAATGAMATVAAPRRR